MVITCYRWKTAEIRIALVDCCKMSIPENPVGFSVALVAVLGSSCDMFFDAVPVEEFISEQNWLTSIVGNHGDSHLSLIVFLFIEFHTKFKHQPHCYFAIFNENKVIIQLNFFNQLMFMKNIFWHLPEILYINLSNDQSIIRNQLVNFFLTNYQVAFITKFQFAPGCRHQS